VGALRGSLTPSRDGDLFTYRLPDLGVDTGLRFGKPHADGVFRCPGCGAHVAELVASE
jgi:hypothetical protein